VWHDLKFAVRMLRARPGFTLVVVATLALGIGANTAIFTAVDAVVLRPLPFREPQRLFFVAPTNPKDGDRDRPATLAEVDLLRAQLRSFEGLAAASPLWNEVVTEGGGAAAVVETMYVTPDLLAVLGVTPALGRAFSAEEALPQGPVAVVLTHASWQGRFAGDPAILGRTLVIEGKAARIVGVLPAGVTFLGRASELWIPLAQNPTAMSRRLLTVVGRLRPGARAADARAELGAAARPLEDQFPDADAGVQLRLTGLHEQLTSAVRPTLLLLLGAVALVLLIACANVANLTLARAVTRSEEMAVRVALGARRGRLVRQLVTEGVLLSLLGGAAGIGLARWGVDLAAGFGAGVPLTIDGGVLAFTLALSVLTGVLSSLAPVWRVWHVDARLRGGGRGATGAPGQRRLSSALVAAEMALALVLLVGAGLLIRTVGRLLDVDPGFTTRNLLTMQIYLPSGVDEEGRRRLVPLIEERLRSLPGVAAAGVTTRLPLAPARVNLRSAIEIQGEPVPRGRQPEIDYRRASAAYFPAMSIPLLGGRLPAPGARDQVVVNEAAARRFWPGRDPLGHRVRTAASSGPPGDWLTVVGVVGSVRHLGLDVEPRPELFFQTDSFGPSQNLVLRTTGDPRLLAGPVRAALLELDRRLAITGVTTMEGLILDSVAQRRFVMLLLGAFAGVALLLAAIGLYGVMSYAVIQRRTEIGVRMALGAQEGDVSRMVVRQGMTLALAGAAIGLGAALALGRLMSSLLYGVSATDPATLAVVCLLLGAVALLACYLPARRATHLDPMIALRQG
jgi:predicted permease